MSEVIATQVRGKVILSEPVFLTSPTCNMMFAAYSIHLEKVTALFAFYEGATRWLETHKNYRILDLRVDK